MTVTPGGGTPILGRGPEGTNNPLVVLNNHLGQMTDLLGIIAAKVSGDLPHVYVVARQDAEHVGAYWGSFCLACTDEASEFVFPCSKSQDPIHPPNFFTIGDVLVPDANGRMLRYQPPSA